VDLIKINGGTGEGTITSTRSKTAYPGEERNYIVMQGVPKVSTAIVHGILGNGLEAPPASTKEGGTDLKTERRNNELKIINTSEIPHLIP